MAINFIIDNGNIVLDYESETQPINWIDDRLDENGNYVFNNTFTVSKKNYYLLSIRITSIISDAS